LEYQEFSELKDKITTEKLYLEEDIRSDQNIGNMIGESPAFQSVLRSIQIVAPTASTVLIQGETGTGKELVARAIHDLSARRKRSFVTNSTVRPFPPRCSKANCLGMRKVLSLAHSPRRLVPLSSRVRGRCSGRDRRDPT